MLKSHNFTSYFLRLRSLESLPLFVITYLDPLFLSILTRSDYLFAYRKAAGG